VFSVALNGILELKRGWPLQKRLVEELPDNIQSRVINDRVIRFYTRATSDDPYVSVVIPSLDGYRGGNVPRLLKQVFQQSVEDLEALVVIGVRPNGRARNVGVREVRGQYLICIDDDVTLGHDRLIENLIRPFENRDDIGMTGASQLIPPDSNQFQRTVAAQVPRTVFAVQDELKDSDMVTHMCLCMPTRLFKDVGWENGDIVSGTDPDLRHRVREAGLRVVIVPDTWAYHPVPESPSDFWAMCRRKGRHSAHVQVMHPELVLELDAGDREEFPPRRTFAYRACRFGFMVMSKIVTGQFVFVMARLCYAIGYIGHRLGLRMQDEHAE
jgi:glycosyltransferase involved in cell wall biosynthesis